MGGCLLCCYAAGGRGGSVVAAGGQAWGSHPLRAGCAAGVLILSFAAEGGLLPSASWDLCLQQSSRTEEEE
jgi:hypothetical protein